MASFLPDVHGGARYLANVRVTLRDGFFVGLSTVLFCGLFLIWFWQPDRQVRRHTQKLFHQVEAKNWSAVSDLIGSDYSDQWSHDRTNLIERMREVMRYLRGMRIVTEEPVIKIEIETLSGWRRLRLKVTPAKQRRSSRSESIHWARRSSFNGVAIPAGRGIGNWFASAIRSFNCRPILNSNRSPAVCAICRVRCAILFWPTQPHAASVDSARSRVTSLPGNNARQISSSRRFRADSPSSAGH